MSVAIIFNKMGIDTAEVLEAAGTKWNFLKFKPGLVGGHCIGVDPYYLTYQAENSVTILRQTSNCHFERREKSACAFSTVMKQISHPMRLGSK